MKWGRVAVASLLLVACGDGEERASSFQPTVADDEAGTGDGESGTGGPDATGTTPTSQGPTTDPSTTAGETTGDDTGPGTTTGADPNCYEEPLFPDADIADVVGAYGGPDWKDDLIEAMNRRWPAGAFLLNEQRNDSYFNQFSDPNNWEGMVGWLDTLVHEETHLYNAYNAQGQGEAHSLFMREDLIFYLPPDQGFPRSEILQHMAPEAAAGIYSDTYFTGTQGARQFNPLLDETSCYLNEVPGMSVFGEYYDGFGFSLRDGSAAFLYFIELYLWLARTEHPEFYGWAKSQEVYVEAVLTLWLRTHYFYEEVADMYPNLGVSDQVYRDLMHQDDLMNEISMFTGVTVDASSCHL